MPDSVSTPSLSGTTTRSPMPKAASERATTQRAVASERLAALSDARYPIYGFCPNSYR